ncbi:MAG TPA: hypothetical protein VMD29_16900 [Terracidiphilus sp.]|nr:hypothetical protein [Terracidiphilus sp.]
MRFPFSKFFLIPAFAAATAFVSQPAQAKTVDIPFNFSAFGHEYPAGTYIIEEGMANNVVTLHLKDGAQSFMTVLEPGDPNSGDHRVVVRFVSTANGHALDWIQFGDKVSPRFASRAARESEERSAGGE